MTDNDEKIFMEELSSLLRKYNLKNCIFAGNNDDDKMIGIFCIEKYGIGHSMQDSVLSFANSARMYQSSRELILKIFDKTNI